ncbi:MAG: copper amine oxidase N-terminal domain-containing protein [Syntrophomonadaceae bacterium]
MKRLSIIFSVIFLLFSWAAVSVAAYTYPSIILDGQQLSIAVPAIDEHGRTLVPVRAFFEALGAAVSWDEGTQTVTIKKDDKEIKLTIGQTTAKINGTAVDLDTPPQVVDGRILVPLRFVTEAIGASVAWNAETQVINIQTTSPSGNGQSPPATPGSDPNAVSVPGEPDNATPTAPTPGNNNPLAVDFLNPTLMLYILVSLLVIGLLAGAFLLRRSRTNRAHKQVEIHEAAEGGETEQQAEEQDVVDWEEVDHLAATNGLVNQPEEQHLESTQAAAATIDNGFHMDTGDMAQSGATARDAATDEGIAAARKAAPDKGMAAMEAAHPGDTYAATDTGQADGPAETDTDLESVEAYYHKGVGLIRLQNWTEARLALVYPSIVKYRDSEELGYYIEAVEHYQESKNPHTADPYWAAVMADYYCRKIPDDYEGTFKAEILALKSACKSNLAGHMQNLEM